MNLTFSRGGNHGMALPFDADGDGGDDDGIDDGVNVGDGNDDGGHPA